MQGSTDTTFYILSVYFGAIGVTKTRHAVLAGLLTDAAGIAAAVFICHLVWGGLG
jgi:spore maturation protein SpmB